MDVVVNKQSYTKLDKALSFAIRGGDKKIDFIADSTPSGRVIERDLVVVFSTSFFIVPGE